MEDEASPPDPDWPNGDSPAPPSGTQNGHSSSEPACDQCRMRKVRCNREHPKCSNCRKSKVPCGFSNKGKRVNHINKLVNNVDVLGKRMDKIEAAVLRCVDAIEQHISVTTTSSPVTTSPSSSKAKSSDREIDSLALVKLRATEVDENQSLIEDQEDWFFAPEKNIRHLVTEGGGYEYFFGSGSLYSIWTDIMCSTEKLFAQSQPFDASRGSSENQDPQSLQRSSNSAVIAALDPELKSALHRACEHIQSFCAKPPLEECSDGTPLSLPPRFLLEAILDSFLRELNPTFPIFARSSLLAAIEVQYDAQRHQLDPAWATCFNNLILQALTIKAGIGAESLSRNTIDESLRTTFVVNAQRGYRNLEALLKPRIVNVQAFLSMALVALKYFRYAIFETLFALACQVAKAVGLHQQVDSGTNHNISNAERINLFWTLFITDKQLALMCGKSCYLHGFDCDIPLPASEVTSEVPIHDHWVAAIKLSFLNEDIYRSLYSAESTRVSDIQRQRKVELLTQKLINWATAHQQTLIGDDTWSSQKSSFSLELRYSMLTSQVLVLRRSKKRESNAQLLTNARASLKVIKDLCQAPSTIASNVAFERILLHYPLVAFADLYKNITQEVSIAPPEDIQLLEFVAERISNHAATASRLSYMAKLKTATTLCSGVCTSIKRAKELNKTTSLMMPTSPLPDRFLTGLGHCSQPSDPFLLSPNPTHRVSIPPGNFSWDTNDQTLSENVSATGIFSGSPNFQLQSLANAPHVTNRSFSNNLENASRATHEPPQTISIDDWPLAMVSDPMDYSSCIDSLGPT